MCLDTLLLTDISDDLMYQIAYSQLGDCPFSGYNWIQVKYLNLSRYMVLGYSLGRGSVALQLLSAFEGKEKYCYFYFFI